MSPSGILLVDKPGGITSHDVVSRARKALGTRKVGHAGTLDPMATGLLLLGVDSATRLLTYLVGLDKEYAATIRLGVATDTDDAEGAVTATVDAASVTRERIDAGIAELTGEISQVPSSFSAVKVDGRRSYDRARAGEEVVLAPRERHDLPLRRHRRAPRCRRRRPGCGGRLLVGHLHPRPGPRSRRRTRRRRTPHRAATHLDRPVRGDGCRGRRRDRPRGSATPGRDRGTALPDGDPRRGPGRRPRARQTRHARHSPTPPSSPRSPPTAASPGWSR